MRIHEREGRRGDLRDAVVVGHDHVDPVARGGRHLGDARRPRVDGEQEAAATLARRRDGLQREPVALVHAARHVGGDVQPQPAERRHEDREAGQAVGVEVADDEDALAAVAGEGHASHDGGRVRQQGGIVEPQGRRTEVGVDVVRLTTPRRARTVAIERRAPVRLDGRHERGVRRGSIRIAPPVAGDQHRGSIARAAYVRLHGRRGAAWVCGGGHAEARRTGRPGVARSLRRASHSSQTVRSGAALKIEE